MAYGGGDTPLNKALRLVRQGLPVFPCNPDKTPATRNGFYDATSDPELVSGWGWRDDHLIGVATGAVSGLAVLDIDPRNGGYDWLETHSRPLPFTRSHRTRSGGVHLLFKTDGSVRCSASRIAPGVDVRGEKGCFIWWPAHDGMVLDFLPLKALPPWPSWLVPERPNRAFEGNGRGVVLADRYRIAGLIRYVRNSRNGRRNTDLYWAMCRIAEMRFINSEQRDQAIDQMFHAALAVGEEEAKAISTIQSALSTIDRSVK